MQTPVKELTRILQHPPLMEDVPLSVRVKFQELLNEWEKQVKGVRSRIHRAYCHKGTRFEQADQKDVIAAAKQGKSLPAEVRK